MANRLACPLLLLTSLLLLLLAMDSVQLKYLADASQKIEDIVQKAKVVGDRVRKLFRLAMDSVKHVDRDTEETLANLEKLKGILHMEMAANTVAASVHIIGWMLMITLLLKRWLSVKKQQ